MGDAIQSRLFEAIETLLQPISKRAAKEIEKQLNNAEKSVTDPTILTVLAFISYVVVAIQLKALNKHKKSTNITTIQVKLNRIFSKKSFLYHTFSEEIHSIFM